MKYTSENNFRRKDQAFAPQDKANQKLVAAVSTHFYISAELTELIAQTGCGAHPASYSGPPYRLWGPPSFFLNKIPATLSPGGRAAGREAHHWRPSTADVEVYIHFLLCLNGVHECQFTFTHSTHSDSTRTQRQYYVYGAFALTFLTILLLHSALSNLGSTVCPFCPVPEHAALTACLSCRSPASTGNSELLFHLIVQLNMFCRRVSKCPKCLGDSGFISRNASCVQRQDKMDILYNTVIEQVKKNLDRRTSILLQGLAPLTL